MMLLKWMGCILLLSAGGSFALCSVRREKKKLTVLDGWIDLIFYIRTQIDCYLTPLGELLAAASPAMLTACTAEGEAVPELEGLLEKARCHLGGESERLLSGFVREIGTGYREEQVKRCDYYLALLREEREKLQTELPQKNRVTVALSVCSAIAVSILLW